MQLVNIGFNNLLSAGRVLAVLGTESQPVKRMAQEARAAGLLIDACQGRRARAALLMDTGHIALSYLQPETLAAKMGAQEELE